MFQHIETLEFRLSIFYSIFLISNFLTNEAYRSFFFLFWEALLKIFDLFYQALVIKVFSVPLRYFIVLEQIS